MAIVFTYEMTSDLVTARTHKKILREAYRRALMNHREKRLGKHYRENAETRPGGGYGYDPRNPEYVKRKQRVKGHRRPLVWSGRLQRFVRNNSRITATAKGGRLKTPVIRKRRREFVSQYVRELEAITPAEQKEIINEIREFYLAAVQKPENRRQRRVRVTG